VLGYGNVIGVPISRQEAWDVNDPLDLLVADALLRQKQQAPANRAEVAVLASAMYK
jgi:hypothetical protein